jgi:hypothetical protein
VKYICFEQKRERGEGRREKGEGRERREKGEEGLPALVAVCTEGNSSA